MKKIRYFFETVAVYAFYYSLAPLPLSVASDIGGIIGRFLGKLLPVSKIAKRNIEIAFPKKTSEEKQKILEGMWDNLGRVAAEYSHLKNIWNEVEVRGLENIKEAKESNTGSIFFSAHIANWEAASLAAQRNGVDVSLVYRRPNNLGVENLLQKSRSHESFQVIPKGSAGAKKMVSVLKSGGALGVLMDQKLNEGENIPFFGKDAKTAKAVAHFALKLGSPLFPARVERIEGCKLRVTIYPKLEFENTGDVEKDTFKILTQINATMEEWIRERPEQWLWIHKRWGKEEYI